MGNKAKIITKLYMQCFKIKKFDIRKSANKKIFWVKQHSFHFKLGNCIKLMLTINPLILYTQYIKRYFFTKNFMLDKL